MKASRFSLALPSIVAVTILTMIVMFPGWAAGEQVIHSFGVGSDGNDPMAGLVRGKEGRLYGTTLLGGEHDEGAVFELTPPTVSGEAWTETVLYSFRGGADGFEPQGSLIFDEEGNLYGTTEYGGSSGIGFGTVFKLTPPTVSGGAWTETVLYSFKGNKGHVLDGEAPYAALVIGWEGSLYGTTTGGGAFGYGTVFRLTKSKTGTWTEEVIHSFDDNGTDGLYPGPPLIHDKAGNLYGTTYLGGSGTCFDGESCGVVFELSPPAVPGEPWTETILHDFTGTAGDGANPAAPLIMDVEGDLYGTTWGGGEFASTCQYGCGTVFELLPAAGGGWAETILYSFTGGSDGAGTNASVVFDSAGNLYGDALFGGHVSKHCGNGCGTVYELSPPSTLGGTWSETTLYEFQTGWEGGSDGGSPSDTLIFGKYGALYGTTEGGGTEGDGTVFSIQP